MARASTVCLTHGCPEIATHGSYCEQHKQKRSGRGSTWQWRKVRQRILARDGYRCTHMDGPHRCPITDDLHVDHILPVKHGGTDVPENLTTLCWDHNLRKGDRLPE